MASPSPLLESPVLRADLERVEDALRASVVTEDPFLTEVASHLIKAGGKRIRPAFSLVSGAARHSTLKAASDEVVMGGVSVELVHLGSLYHDDVMDDATTRRTVESVNYRWGNLKAILAGDYLLAKASEIAASLGTEVAGLLAATIGRLCEGQVVELQEAFNIGRSEDAYMRAINGKTASLLASSCRIGAIVADLDRDQIDALTTFGHGFGMAFQMVDDILDLVATNEQLGKPAGNDLVEGIYTLPVIRTIAAGGPEADLLSELLGSPLDEAQMDKARAAVREGGQIASALETAREHVEMAIGALEAIDGSESQATLMAGAQHLLSNVTALV